MSQIKFTLNEGLTLGEEALKEVVLRDVIAGDIIDASEESEKLVYTPEPVLIASPAMMGVHILRRQIVSIGNVTGPIEVKLLGKLSAEDLELLQTKAEELESAAVAQVATQAVSQKGRPDNRSE